MFCFSSIFAVKEAIEHQADQHLSSIPALSAFCTGDLPEGIVFGDVHSPFPTLLHNMATNLPHATLVALNSFHSLHPDIDTHFASSFKKFLHIGPFNLLSPLSSPHQQNKDDECLTWLDNQSPASVVYISFGTVLMPPPPQLEELALGLESSGAPFLWALKDKAKEGLPAGFLDRTKGRGLVVSWAPQVKVLGHKSVGAFLTHCGWNSIMESITNGVPMICKPFFGDQRANARMVSHAWRFGVVLDVDDEGRLRREEVGRVVNVVLKEGEEMRGRVCELKKQGMQAAEPGGSSTQNFKSLVEVVCGMPKV